jgi:polar amino acid transport system substrate-binding protein
MQSWNFKRETACASLVRRAVAGLVASLIFCPQAVQGETYKVSVPELPITTIFLEDLKNIEAANPGLKFEIAIAPFPRSIKAVVEDRTADIHYPIIRPIDDKALPFDVSTSATTQVPFTIYVNKSKLLDVNDLKQYKIETDFAHTGVFPFPTIGSGDIGASLRKVDAGRIDGFILDEYSTDKQLIAGGFKNISRKLYGWMDVCFVLPKGSKGGPLDQALTRAVEAAKNNQGYRDAIAKARALHKDENWQQ